VAANALLRAGLASLAEERGLPLHLPPPALCTDNAAMVAFLGERLAQEGLGHDLRLEAVARGRPVPADFKRCVKGPADAASA
jgi:N6-L-threonylcarbamoyladenine synthase